MRTVLTIAATLLALQTLGPVLTARAMMQIVKPPAASTTACADSF